MKKLLATICFLGLAGLVVGVGVFAGEEASVTTTVTPYVLMLSISVNPSAVDFGTMGVSEVKTSPSCGEEGQINVYNDTASLTDVTIRGTDTQDWILYDYMSPGDEMYKMEYCNCSCWATTEQDPNCYTAMMASTENTPFATLGTGGEYLEVRPLLLRFYTPTSTVAVDPQTSTVTLTATLHTP